MPYDASLDKQLFLKSYEAPDGMKINISVYSYNNGPKKVQLSRESANAEGEPRFAKLGRLTKDELQAVLPLLQEALNQL
ncbi:MAG: hypothetical protein MOGMAGMI_00776 [Candidatus Omnitrophica bacterium]|nr:hypothetical protein [Candidatus Omnitrophota bacterium]